MNEFIFTWSIENISYAWHKADEPISSPGFTAFPLKNTEWILQLYPRGQSNPDYFSLFLNRIDSGSDISLNMELACISADNALLHSYNFQGSVRDFQTFSARIGVPRFMPRHEVFARQASYLPRDVLTLRCRIWEHEGLIEQFGECFARTRLLMEGSLFVDNIIPEMSFRRLFYDNSEISNGPLISITVRHLPDSIKVVVSPENVDNIKYSVMRLSLIEATAGKVIYEHTSSWLGEHEREIWRFPISKLLHPGNGDSIKSSIALQSEFVYSTGEQTEHIENFFSGPYRLLLFVSKYINSCIPSGVPSDCPGIFQSLWNLYVEHIFCDLELKTQKTSFFVHQFVLGARSPVFLAMLTGDMKEKRTKCIEIEDIADDILEKFLHFLYTDSFQDIEWGTTIGLYYAADKYQVERLKILCCSYFLKNITVNNVCQLLMLADRHQHSDFKIRVEDFVLEQDDKVFSSSAWKQFVDDIPHLPAKTMLLKYDKERENQDRTESYKEILFKLPKIGDDFINLYTEQIFIDLKFKTTDMLFPVHKLVVCASSFKMRKVLIDNPTEVLEIQGLKDETVTQMIVFLYSGTLEHVEWDTAMQLYKAADFYEMQSLKFQCSCFLLGNIDTSKASDLLLFALEHQDERLKSVVEDYILLHDKEIFGSDAWAEFSERNLRLANETMRAYCRKKFNSKFMDEKCYSIRLHCNARWHDSGFKITL